MIVYFLLMYIYNVSNISSVFNFALVYELILTQKYEVVLKLVHK